MRPLAAAAPKVQRPEILGSVGGRTDWLGRLPRCYHRLAEAKPERASHTTECVILQLCLKKRLRNNIFAVPVGHESIKLGKTIPNHFKHINFAKLKRGVLRGVYHAESRNRPRRIVVNHVVMEAFIVKS
jgi:hypothetical protein